MQRFPSDTCRCDVCLWDDSHINHVGRNLSCVERGLLRKRNDGKRWDYFIILSYWWHLCLQQVMLLIVRPVHSGNSSHQATSTCIFHDKTRLKRRELCRRLAIERWHCVHRGRRLARLTSGQQLQRGQCPSITGQQLQHSQRPSTAGQDLWDFFSTQTQHKALPATPSQKKESFDFCYTYKFFWTIVFVLLVDWTVSAAFLLNAAYFCMTNGDLHLLRTELSAYLIVCFAFVVLFSHNFTHCMKRGVYEGESSSKRKY